MTKQRSQMVTLGTGVLAALIVVGLAVGSGVGYFVRAADVFTLQRDVATATESKGMIQAELDQAKADLAKAKESKGMIEEELKAAKANLAKAIESKSMLEAELKGKPVAIPFVAEKGQMAHDLWLIIAPVEGGKYAISIRAEGLEAKGVYLVEGVTRTVMKAVPVATTVPASEFVADEKGNGLYWLVLDKDPHATFEKILILFLPEMQMERAVTVASATLG